MRLRRQRNRGNGRQAPEFVDAVRQLIGGKRGQSIRPERLDAEGGYRTSVDQCILQGIVVDGPARGKVSGESAHEGVSGPGRVLDVFERIGWNRKYRVVHEQQCAVLALLDDNNVRSHGADQPGRTDEIRFARQFAGFRIVDHKTINTPQQGLQGIRRMVNPEVHGVTDHQIGIGNLIKDTGLDRRIEIAKTQDPAVQIGGRHIGPEGGQDVQVRIERVARIQIVVVPPPPGKGLPVLLDLKPFQVHAIPLHDVHVFVREVISDHRHQARRRTHEPGGHGDVHGATAQDTVTLTKRSLDPIESDRTYSENTHVFPVVAKKAPQDTTPARLF